MEPQVSEKGFSDLDIFFFSDFFQKKISKNLLAPTDAVAEGAQLKKKYEYVCRGLLAFRYQGFLAFMYSGRYW
jgi:hypothetical protein